MKGDRDGFTLLELLVVIAIIGILAAVGLPTLRRDTPQVRDAARVVAADLNRARSEAIRLNATLGVTFSPSNGSYRVFVDDLNTPDNGRVVFQRNLTSEFPFTALTSTNFPNNTLWFDVRGLPRNSGSGFGSGTIVLHSKRDSSYKLEVRIASQGRVKWVRPAS